MAGSPERQMVLKMLSEGRIGAEEAEELLAALDRAERHPNSRGEESRRPDAPGEQPELDLGEIGRGIREAVRGLTEGFEKLTRTVPWGRDLGEWFKSALGGTRSAVERPVVCPPDATGDRVTVKATNGSVTIRGRGAGRPAGRANVTAWSSDEASARRLAEEIRVFTTVRDGALEISCQAATASARITTSSGDVVLRLAPEARVRVEAATASGEVVVRAPLRVEELGRSRFVGVQGEADATVRLSSSSGDLRIESPGA